LCWRREKAPSDELAVIEKRMVWDDVSFIASPLYLGRTYGRGESGALSTTMLLFDGRRLAAARERNKIIDSIHSTRKPFLMMYCMSR
jgi:hypothetical protein